MKRWRWYGLSGWVAAVVVTMAWVVQAGPLLPERSKLSGELQSLAGLKRVGLRVSDLPPMLKEAGFTKVRAQKILVKRLEGHGIEVVKDQAPVGLELWFKEVSVPDHPKMACVVTSLAVYQSVQVTRLGRVLTVPTACFVSGAVTDRESLVEDLSGALNRWAQNVAWTIQNASLNKSP